MKEFWMSKLSFPLFFYVQIRQYLFLQACSLEIPISSTFGQQICFLVLFSYMLSSFISYLPPPSSINFTISFKTYVQFRWALEFMFLNQRHFQWLAVINISDCLQSMTSSLPKKLGVTFVTYLKKILYKILLFVVFFKLAAIKFT